VLLGPVPRRRLSRIAGNAALLGCGLVLSVVASEFLVRLLVPQQRALAVALRNLHRPDPELGYVMVPDFYRRIRTPEFECDVRTNSYGMHERPIAPHAPGKLRVLGLGDSFVFGVHAGALDRCFLKRLESLLGTALASQPATDATGRTWSGIEFLNAGVDGYGTLQEVGLLERLGPALEPDAVLLAFYLGNDFTDNSGRTRMTVVDGYQMLEASAHGYRAHVSRPDRRLRVWLHAHSHLYLLLKRRLVHPMRHASTPHVAQAAESGGDSPGVASAPARSFEYFVYDSGFAETLRLEPTAQLDTSMRATGEALRRLHDWCRDHGAKPVLVAIPAEVQVSAQARQRWLDRFDLDPNTLDFSAPNRRLAALAAEAEIPVVDLTPEFAARGDAGEDLYLRLDDHWNAAGHAAAATALATGPLLDELLGLPAPLAGSR
jgi:SGNH hydrolase-like domain, acetyltransferase AlgX